MDIPSLPTREQVLWLVLAIVAVIAKSGEATPTTSAGGDRDVSRCLEMNGMKYLMRNAR
jgi:hypothetical protein